MTPAKSRKKLIEVALSLDAINRAAAREKSMQGGSPALMRSQLPRYQRHRAGSISRPSRP